MRSPYTTLYVHCVWSTWNRLPLLTAAIRPIVYSAIAKECEALNCSAIAIGSAISDGGRSKQKAIFKMLGTQGFAQPT